MKGSPEMIFAIGADVRVCPAPGYLWDDIVIDRGRFRSGGVWYKTAKYPNIRRYSSEVWHTREHILGLNGNAK